MDGEDFIAGTGITVFVLLLGAFLYLDWTDSQDHARRGLKVGSITEIERESGGYNVATEMWDSPYYHVYITDSTTGRIEEWRASEEYGDSLRVGMRIQPDTSHLRYYFTSRSSYPVPKAKEAQ